MSSPPERRRPNPPQPVTPIRVSGPSDEQNLRQIFAPVQLLYAISAGIPPHSGAVNVGIQEVIGPGGTAIGPDLTFTGGGVTNIGNTFTFSSTGSHGVTTLTSNFTIPSAGNTGSMSVADGFAFTQGQTFLIPNGTTVDQQAYIGQVVSGGGVSGAATVTVITRSLGTYSTSGTILSGATVTWGNAASIGGTIPPIVQSVGSISGPMILTLGSAPTVGNQMYTVLTASAGITFNTLSGWALVGVTTTASGSTNVTMAVYRRQVQAGDGPSYTWTASGGIRSGYLVEISGAAVSLQQFNITDTSGESFAPTSPPLSPYAPNSLVLSFFCMGNGYVASTPTGWSEIAFVNNSGDIANLSVVQGPATTTNPIEATVTTSDTAATALLILPPASGGSGALGITQINAQTGPFISVIGSTYLGVSTSANQLQLINSGLTTVTGPSATITGPFSILGPAVLQIGGNEFYISTAGGGGGGSTGNTYDSTVSSTSGITNYWKLNETSGTTAFDSIGSNNGTYNGTVAYGAAIGPLAAVRFDGTTTCVTVTLTPPGGTSAQSFEYWYMPQSIETSGGRNHFGFNNASNNYTYAIGDLQDLIAGDGVYYAVNNGAGTGGGFLPSCGVPMHIVLTYDGTTLKIYINTMPYINTAVATLGASPTALVIGGLRAGSATPTTLTGGVISRVALYNVTISQATIGAHYQAFW